MAYRRPSKKYPKNWWKLRWVIFKRDNYTCQICGFKGNKNNNTKPKLECHHKIPIWKGGSHHPDNLMTVCEACHTSLDNIQVNK